MRSHIPALIVVLPLFFAALTPLLALWRAGAARAAALIGLTVTLGMAAEALVRSLREGTVRYHLGGWAPPWGIEYVIDPLSAGMAVLIALFGLIAVVYAGPFLSRVPRLGAGGFYALLLLLVTGLLGMVVTGDLFNLYVFLEISSLAVYGLIALGGNRSMLASFRYLLIGTLGGTFYLLGLGYLYGITGTLNMADMAVRLPAVIELPAAAVGVALIVTGLALKAALFPLHGWLPDAYTFAPAPVAAFVAAVMTKVSVYALFRFLFFVVPPSTSTAGALMVLGWAAALAAVAGSIMALRQSDVRRILAYSSVGQIGYIVMGLAIGTPIALTGALLHVLNHAVMKGCLFLVAGGVRFRTGATDVATYSGVATALPVSMAAFAAASLVGLPPTAGFFSKWYLLLAAIEAGLWPFAAALIASSLISAVYLYRVAERAYFGDSGHRQEEQPGFFRELPAAMLAPIVALAAAVVLLGVWNDAVVTRVISLALPDFGA